MIDIGEHALDTCDVLGDIKIDNVCIFCSLVEKDYIVHSDGRVIDEFNGLEQRTRSGQFPDEKSVGVENQDASFENASCAA